MKVKLTIEYDGRPFVGWQAQANGVSVQSEIERAVLAFSGEPARLTAAGRTDAGVHALGQVAHLELARDWPAQTVMKAINAHLRPLPIAILLAEIVGKEFDARFSAIRRAYLYRIVNRAAPLALEEGRAWGIVQPLDAGSMAEAAKLLVGRHDFTSFRAAQCQAKNALRTLDLLSVVRDGEEIRVVAEARSFLHHQVRNMVGTLVQVGLGRWDAGKVAAAFEARDRAAAGPTAPPDGLYFTRVDYPGG